MTKPREKDEPDWEVDWEAVDKSVRELGPLAAHLPRGPVAAVRKIKRLFEEYERRRAPHEPSARKLARWMKDRVLAEYWTNAPGVPCGRGDEGYAAACGCSHTASSE